METDQPESNSPIQEQDQGTRLPEPPAPRIDIRELTLNEETGAHCLDDEPFSGIGCLYYHPSGAVAEESVFVDGRKHGLSRKWYPSGALKSEAQLVDESAEGPFREWHENGRLKREGTFDHSIFIEFREWDDQGRLIEEYRMQEGDPLYEHLMFLKQLEEIPPPPA